MKQQSLNFLQAPVRLWTTGLLLLAVSASAGARATTANNPVVAGSNKMGLQVYEDIVRNENKNGAQNRQENIFFSPFSLNQALGLLLNGTSGESFKNLASAMDLEGLTYEQINNQNRELLHQLQTSPADSGAAEFKLEIANAVLADLTFPMKPSYMKSVKNSFDAEVHTLDFKNPSSADKINSWVSEKTHKKITAIVNADSIHNQVALLLNATYFKADWKTPFNAARTHERNFTNLSGKTSKVQMMNKSDHLRHVTTADYEAVELPYGKNNAASMLLVLPSNFESFESTLDASTLASVYASLSEKTELGTLSMPKFKFEKEIDLVHALSQTPMASLFGHADLGRMSDDPRLFVSGAFQKSFVAVDEKGTEAAAVTGISVGATSIPVYKFEMSIDRPFMIVIRDNTTGMILFIGSIVNL